MNLGGLYDFLREYTEFFEKIAGQEPRENAGLIPEELAEVERFLTRREALVKQIENWEGRRAEQQAAVGFAGLTFREILARVPEGERERFSAIFDRLEKAVSQMKFLNEKSARAVHDRLEAIARVFPEAVPAVVGEYAPPASPRSAPPRSGRLETKI